MVVSTCDLNTCEAEASIEFMMRLSREQRKINNKAKGWMSKVSLGVCENTEGDVSRGLQPRVRSSPPFTLRQGLFLLLQMCTLG